MVTSNNNNNNNNESQEAAAILLTAEQLQSMTVKALKERIQEQFPSERTSHLRLKNDFVSFLLTEQQQEQEITLEEDEPETQEDLFLELTDDDDDDDDEEEYEEDGRTYEEFRDEMEAWAFLSPMDETAAQSAQDTFDAMFDAFMMEDDPSLAPDSSIYNLLLEAHAASPNKRGAQRAQHILDLMEQGEQEKDTDTSIMPLPNGDTYTIVMNGWATQRQPSKTQQVFDQWMARYEEASDPDNATTLLQPPTTEAYNTLIKAYAKSGDASSPAIVERILNGLLDNSNNSGSPKPDSTTFVRVMNCIAQSAKTEADVAKVQLLLETMERLSVENEDEGLKPNTRAYNALIKAL
eukprot:scaffold74058_cov60-Attheya_sp.AAC.1